MYRKNAWKALQEGEMAKLEAFASQGWARSEGEQGGGQRWWFTPEGFLLSNRLIGELLEIQEEQQRRSVPRREG